MNSKTRVRIIHDDAAYTHGCYHNATGTIECVREVPLDGGASLRLCFVAVDSFPLDDYGHGGHWYLPEELTPLTGAL